MSVVSSDRLSRCAFIILVCLGLLSLTPPILAQETGTEKIIRDIPYRADHESLDEYGKSRCLLDISIPQGKTDFPTVLWFHGGGLKNGKKGFPKGLKNQGFAVVTVGYRLSPHVPVTTCIDDAAAATAWVFEHLKEYGGNPDKVVISGSSAGGYLAMMLGLDQRLLKKYGADANRFAGIGPFSGHAITHMTARAERNIPDTQPVIDELAPLFHVRKDAPPILLLTGDRELEMLGRYEENAYLYRMLKIVGHPDVAILEFPGTNHGTMAEPAYAPFIEFVNRVTQSAEK